jgi:hypothetical protein
MTPSEVAAILRQFNEWRRGNEDIPQPDPREIGAAIDAAVEMIERTSKTELEIRDRNDLIVRLQNELRGYREREKTMGWQE